MEKKKLQIAAEFLRELSLVYSNRGNEEYPGDVIAHLDRITLGGVIGLDWQFTEYMHNDDEEAKADNTQFEFESAGWLGIAFLADELEKMAQEETNN